VRAHGTKFNRRRTATDARRIARLYSESHSEPKQSCEIRSGEGCRACSRFGFSDTSLLLVHAPPLFPIILLSVQTTGLMTREVSAPSQAFDDDDAAASSIGRPRCYDGARARRLGVLYAAGFVFVATVRVLHDSGYSSSSSSYDSFAAPQPSQLQVVFRQSLNGASRPYLRCRLGEHAVAAATAGEATQDATTSRSQEDKAWTVASPGSLGGSEEEEETSLEDDPFNQVEGSKSRRYRGENKEPHRTPPSSRSRKHGRSRSARSARSKQTESERGRMT
jgi:hypothetical protein